MSFRDRLAWDAGQGEYRDSGIRYMMIRNDALMGLFAQLPPEARLPALQALGRSIREFGGKSAAAYQAMGAVDPAAMLHTIAETAPQLGWGVWTFHGDTHLTVENSPFAAAGPSPHPVCHAIVGMLEAIGPLIRGHAVTVTEHHCAASHGGTKCQFTLT